MTSTETELRDAVEGLLNGKQPKDSLRSGSAAEALAVALASRIDDGVAPSRCAHAMCCSSAVGIVPVVKMLSERPMSTFNKAYNFGEPLRRACRAFVKEANVSRQVDLGICALHLVHANGSLDQPDKYLKSGISAAGSLTACGSVAAMELLAKLREAETKLHIGSSAKGAAASRKAKKEEVDQAASDSRGRNSKRKVDDSTVDGEKKKHK
jgi:hypothetical protein